jgi:hypothetical protein
VTIRAPGDLIGRQELLSEIVQLDVALVLLVGDSGIGKSELLHAAQVAADPRVRSSPQELRSAEGAVQVALLDALSEALASIIAAGARRDEPVSGLELGRRFAAIASSDLRRVLLSAIAGQARNRLGDEFADLCSEIATNAQLTPELSIVRRLTALRESRVVNELAEIAGDLLELSGARSLEISLDRVELLTEGDARQLADLARQLPPDVRLRGALMDGTVGGRDLLRVIRSGGGAHVAVVGVPPLDVESTRALLRSEGLDVGLSDDVLRATGGYPLHLGDAVQHLRNGGGVHDLPINRDFGAVIDQAWDTLALGVRSCARQLCLLERPLPLDALLVSLGLSHAEWWSVVEELQTRRIFTQVVDELPWFHEQRRRWLLQKLSQDEMQRGAASFVGAVVERLEEPTGWRYSSALASLVAAAGSAIDHLDLRKVAELSRPALAVAGALLELTEAEQRVLDAQSVLDHARAHFITSSADVLGGLAELEAAGFATVRSSGRAAVVYARFTLPVAAAVGGFCQLNLGRAPMPGLASAVWHSLLAPLAGQFEVAAFGVGQGRPGALAADVRRAQQAEATIVGTSFVGSVLLGSYKGTSIFAAAAVDASRVATLTESWEGASGVIGDATFVVQDVASFPGPPVPSARWSSVATDLLGSRPRVEGGLVMPLADRAQMSSVVRSRARDLMSRAERFAGGYLAEAHFFFSAGDRDELLVMVEGMPAGATAMDLPEDLRLDEPYTFLRLAEHLSIPAHANVMHISHVLGRRSADDHPLREFAAAASSSLTEHNQFRSALDVSLEQSALETWLLPQLQRRHADGVAMAESLGLEAPSPEEFFLVTSPAPPEALFYGPLLVVGRRPAVEVTLDYRISDRVLDGWGFAEMEQLLARPGATITGHARASSGLASLAGFGDGEVSVLRSARDLGLSN